MARKVFISFLGANLYSECTYECNGKKLPPTRFIQEATLRAHQANQWAEDSAAYILLTKEARTNNWEVENDKRTTRDGTTIDYCGLKKCLSALKLSFPVIDVSIPKGETEDEIWEIFETTFNLLKEGDLLFFDLTHGFRYLPMLVLVLGNYAKFLKKAEVMAITYGSFDGRDQNTNIAPIVNLLPLSSLQDWTFATANYLENGYSERLTVLSKKELLPFLRDNEKRTPSMEELVRLMSKLQDITLERITCRGIDVVKGIKYSSFHTILCNIEDVVIKPLLPVLGKLRDSVESNTTNDNIHNLFNVALWCSEHHLYQQATTFLEEGVISFFCMRHNIPLDDRDRRELITSAFNIKANNKPRSEQRVKNEDWRPLLEEIINDPLLSYEELVKKVAHLVDLRNDCNHCGFRKSAAYADRIKNSTPKLITKIKSLLFNELLSPSDEISSKPGLFLNLSNHPSEQWSEEQLAAAREYGNIEDMEFPDIPPGATEEELMNFAEKTAKEILQKAENADITVHVMGEMTFTYALISRLKAEGITCVASTTDRIAEEKDGVKTSKFKFVRFREY